MIISIFLLIISNDFVLAREPLVPCGPGRPVPECDLCQLLVLANNITELMRDLAIALGGVFFAWGGFLIMTAGGSEERITKGKQVITITVTGLIIMLVSWIFVGGLLRYLTDSKSIRPWSQITCQVESS
ncbi:MAG: hypothetical protein HZB99_04495 [Candidatus Harrisonbacteria bacterium]|nr:hypothetical protein [Candidatus Harrisonbacteria bacterium]